MIHLSRPGTSGRTLLLLHGTGGDERSLLHLGRDLAPDDALLSPRGSVDEAGAARWFRRLREGVFDEDDLIRRAEELAAFVRAETSGPIVALGYSNGANMAAALLLLHPGLLAGAAMWRGMAPLANPPRATASFGALLLSGREDPFAPEERALALVRDLEAAGGDVRREITAPGHGIVPADVEISRAWLAKFP